MKRIYSRLILTTFTNLVRKESNLQKGNLKFVETKWILVKKREQDVIYDVFNE